MKKKILIVSAGDISLGGVQLFLREWIKAAKEQGFYITWYCPGIVKSQELYDEIRRDARIITGNIGHFPSGIKHIKIGMDIKRILLHDSYNIVHINTGSIPVQFFVIKEAIRAKIPVRIAHSHGAAPDGNSILKTILRNRMRQYIGRFATRYIACGEAAGKWLFGDNIVKNRKYEVVKNKIDVEKFCYNPLIRQEYRSKLKIKDEFLLGSVGAFTNVKNQNFLLDVMKILKKRQMPVKLLLIGENGPTTDSIKERIQTLQLQDVVIMIGRSMYVNCWLQAMDAFVMPSKYEGFPIVSVEAQAAGLPCYISDRVASEINLLECMVFLSIENPFEWADAICEGMGKAVNRDLGKLSVIRERMDLKSGYKDEILSLYGKVDSN